MSNNNLPEKKFAEFIDEHHVLSLATCDDNGQPWCASCFFVYLPEENCFIFTTDDTTRHGENAISNSKVAANIVLETKTVGKIQGLQIAGELKKTEGELLKIAKKAYLKKYPYAVLMKTNLWTLIPSVLKLTDNRMGFGKKLIWEA